MTEQRRKIETSPKPALNLNQLSRRAFLGLLAATGVEAATRAYHWQSQKKAPEENKPQTQEQLNADEILDSELTQEQINQQIKKLIGINPSDYDAEDDSFTHQGKIDLQPTQADDPIIIHFGQTHDVENEFYNQLNAERIIFSQESIRQMLIDSDVTEVFAESLTHENLALLEEIRNTKERMLDSLHPHPKVWQELYEVYQDVMQILSSDFLEGGRLSNYQFIWAYAVNQTAQRIMAEIQAADAETKLQINQSERFQQEQEKVLSLLDSIQTGVLYHPHIRVGAAIELFIEGRINLHPTELLSTNRLAKSVLNGVAEIEDYISNHDLTQRELMSLLARREVLKDHAEEAKMGKRELIAARELNNSRLIEPGAKIGLVYGNNHVFTEEIQQVADQQDQNIGLISIKLEQTH